MPESNQLLVGVANNYLAENLKAGKFAALKAIGLLQEVLSETFRYWAQPNTQLRYDSTLVTPSSDTPRGSYSEVETTGLIARHYRNELGYTKTNVREDPMGEEGVQRKRTQAVTLRNLYSMETELAAIFALATAQPATAAFGLPAADPLTDFGLALSTVEGNGAEANAILMQKSLYRRCV